MKKLLMIFWLAGVLGLPAVSFADSIDPAHPRTITVSGEADAKIAPDQAILYMSLVSRDKNLSAAKEHNDAMAQKLVTIAKQFSIPQEKVATSNVMIAPEYNYNAGQRIFLGYIVNRSLTITIDKMDTPEQLLSAIVEAKIDQVNGLDYQLANPETHAAALRIKAWENAKARASALAQAAGDKLGKAINISTNGDGGLAPPRPIAMLAMVQAASSSVAPSLPGLVELHEEVTVTFELE